VFYLSSSVLGHGWPTVPPPRAPATTNGSPSCDTKSANSPAPLVVEEGKVMSVDWIRPHLPGNNIRYGIAPAGNDGSDADFKTIVTFKYTDTNQQITIPLGSTGPRTLQWYQDSPGPYWNCVDLIVTPKGATPIDGSTTKFAISHGTFDAATGNYTCNKGYSLKTESDGSMKCTGSSKLSGGAIFGILLLVFVLVGCVAFAGTMIFLKVKHPEKYDTVVGKMKSGATKTKVKTVELAGKAKAKVSGNPA